MFNSLIRSRSLILSHTLNCVLPKRALLSSTPRMLPSQQSLVLQHERHISYTYPLFHGHVHKPKAGEELHVTFIDKDGKEINLEVAEGDNLLDIAQANHLDMEGACGGSCACSTCHVIVDPEYYDAIEEPDDDENDMLDLAFGLTETSRLACQIKMTKDIDGIRVALPAMTRNFQAKDFN